MHHPSSSCPPLSLCPADPRPKPSLAIRCYVNAGVQFEMPASWQFHPHPSPCLGIENDKRLPAHGWLQMTFGQQGEAFLFVPNLALYLQAISVCKFLPEPIPERYRVKHIEAGLRDGGHFNLSLSISNHWRTPAWVSARGSLYSRAT